jgi:hypothetical protein
MRKLLELDGYLPAVLRQLGGSGYGDCTNQERRSLMRRVLMLVIVAMVLVLAVASPASAAIHPIASSECAAGSTTSVANTQDPPGQLMLDAIAPNTAIPASGGAALNGDSGAVVCPNNP